MITPAAAAAARARFVALTTFRKTGVGVVTTVWIARDGDDLLVTTPADAGKVKRLRNDPRVELTPSSRFGRIRKGASSVTGTATLIEPGTSENARLTDIFRAKYGAEYRIFLWVERRFSKGGNSDRVLVRIATS